MNMKIPEKEYKASAIHGRLFLCICILGPPQTMCIQMSLMHFQQHTDGTLYDSNFTSPYIGLAPCLNVILN